MMTVKRRRCAGGDMVEMLLAMLVAEGAEKTKIEPRPGG
jgi:hypothetical protein